MSEPFIGQITTMAFGFAPKNYAQCNGQIMSPQQNQALFALLGTIYGGDGRTTFALPNLMGDGLFSALPSADPAWQPGAYVMGQQVGTETVTLTGDQVPQHTHTIYASTAAATEGEAGAGFALGLASAPIYGNAQPMVPLAGGPFAPAGGLPHPNMQPFTALNMCIALTGYYPSQS